MVTFEFKARVVIRKLQAPVAPRGSTNSFGTAERNILYMPAGPGAAEALQRYDGACCLNQKTGLNVSRI